MAINRLELARQAIAGGVGYASAAATAGVPLHHLIDVLDGRRSMTPALAAALAPIVGTTIFAPMSENADNQLLLRRGALP